MMVTVPCVLVKKRDGLPGPPKGPSWKCSQGVCVQCRLRVASMRYTRYMNTLQPDE